MARKMVLVKSLTPLVLDQVLKFTHPGPQEPGESLLDVSASYLQWLFVCSLFVEIRTSWNLPPIFPANQDPFVVDGSPLLLIFLNYIISIHL